MKPPIGPEVPLVLRTCTRDIRWPHGVLCGGEAFLHVIWEWGENGAAGFVCGKHTTELSSKGWTPVQQHELGPDCGMPGSLWDERENRCYVPTEEARLEIEGALARSFA